MSSLESPASASAPASESPLSGGQSTSAQTKPAETKAKPVLKRFVVVSNLPEKRKDLERTSYVFMNRQPRGAALKAANRGMKNIYLYETHTDKVHVFEGSTKRIDTSDKAPEWVERPTHVVPVVKKAKIHRVEFPALDAKKKKAKKAKKEAKAGGKPAKKKKTAPKKKTKKKKKNRG